MKRIVPLLALAGCLMATGPAARATDLTGTFHKPDGTPVNGKLIFLLSQPARLADGSAQVVPMVKIFQVVDGQLEPGAFIYGNDVLLPAGTHYVVRLVDNANNLLFEQRWSITGASLDLGTLTPTTLGVVLADPLVKNSTTEQAVEGPVTFTSPITAFSLTLNGDLNPGTGGLYSLGSATASWRQVFAESLRLRGGPWFDITAFGAVCDGVANDTPAYDAAIAAAKAAGGGRIMFPAGRTCYLQTAPTFGSMNGVSALITEFNGSVRLGATIILNQRRIHFIGTGVPVSTSTGAFGFTPAVRIFGDPGVSPLMLFRASSTTVPPDGGEERTSSYLKSLEFYPATDADGLHFIGFNARQAGESVLDGVRIYATGTGNALKIDSALWISARNNFVFSATGTGNSVRIENNQVGTGLLFFTDGLLVGRGVYWLDAAAMSINGDLAFRDVTSEALNTAFFTYDSPTNATTLENIEFTNVEMADNSPAQSLMNILAAAGRVRYVRIVNSSGNRDGERIVQAGSGRINGLTVWSTVGLNTPDQIGQTDSVVMFTNNELVVGGDGSSGGLRGSFRSLGAAGIGHPLANDLISAAARPNLKLQVSNGTTSGLGNSVSADSVAIFESNANTDITIAAGTTSNSRIRFARSGSPTPGMLQYNHQFNQLRFDANGAEQLMLDPGNTIARFSQRLAFRAGTSFDGIFTHSNTANRTWTFPNFSGTVAVQALATASLDFPEIAAGATAELSVTVSGAAAGDACAVTPADAPEPGLVWSCFVSAANTVVVRLGNITASPINPGAGTWRATVWKN